MARKEDSRLAREWGRKLENTIVTVKEFSRAHR